MAVNGLKLGACLIVLLVGKLNTVTDTITWGLY